MRLSLAIAAALTSFPVAGHGSLFSDVAPADAPAEAGAEGEVESDAGSEPDGASAEEDRLRLPGYALDTVLPCGLRVIVARDASLPVAAVILALELGSEDDPPEHPGLHHALAYQLLLGSRELRPGEVLATVNDAGGITRLSTGAAQIRYESVLPVARLDQLLWVESHRLRAVTVNEGTWRRAVSWASNDPREGVSVPRGALAAAHGDVKGLEHDGRRAPAALRQIELDYLRGVLKTNFRYERATLVVVAPGEPEATLKRVEAAFRELPAAARRVPARTLPSAASTETVSAATGEATVEATGEAAAAKPAEASEPSSEAEGEASAAVIGPRPRVVALGRRKNSAFVYALDSSPSDDFAARALCKVINRQRRASDEPRRARLRCHWERDARRAALVLWPSGVDDPYALVQARIERIASGRDRKLVERIRAPMRANMRHELRLPVELARRLATGSIDGGDGGRRMLEELTGLSLLADPEAIESRAAWIFQPARGVEVRRKQDDDDGEAKPAPEDASEEESTESSEASTEGASSEEGRP